MLPRLPVPSRFPRFVPAATTGAQAQPTGPRGPRDRQRGHRPLRGGRGRAAGSQRRRPKGPGGCGRTVLPPPPRRLPPGSAPRGAETRGRGAASPALAADSGVSRQKTSWKKQLRVSAAAAPRARTDLGGRGTATGWERKVTWSHLGLSNNVLRG